jgi:uncharacterized protein YecE (DUF72 family)
MQRSKQNIWIGTSNIVVPGNKKSFPAPYNLKSRLHYYAQLFNTVEINQTFYKLPKPATFERWAAEVPDRFQFSIKLSKEITHHKNLRGHLAFIDTFLFAAERLQDKKGCLLIQFPGKITLDCFNEVEAILRKITDTDEDKQWKIAVEFRNESWYTGETYELLNMFNTALVMHDMPTSKITEDVTDAPFVYMRFHGQQGNYRGSYSGEFLREKALQIKSMAKQGKQVYVYFNNTIGSAFDNARTLIELTR